MKIFSQKIRWPKPKAKVEKLWSSAKALVFGHSVLHNPPDPKIPAQHFLNPTRRENCDGNEVCSLLPVGQKRHREEILLLQGDSFIFFFFTKEHHAFKKDLSCGHSIHHQRELEGNKHFAFISTVLSELQPT